MRHHQDDLLLDSDIAYFDHAAVSPLTKPAYQEMLTVIDGKAKERNACV